MEYSIRIIIGADCRYMVNICVFDSESRSLHPISSTPWEIMFTCKKGLYTLRIEMNGEIKDEIIIVDMNKEYTISYENINKPGVISPPKQYSSATLGGTYASSREYYTQPSLQFSKTDTVNYLLFPERIRHSSLFIFLRFSSKDRYNEIIGEIDTPFYKDFKILNESGSVVLDFNSGAGIRYSMYDGWAAFSAEVPNGIYYLLYTGKEPRQIPIYVFKGWHTQFFLTLDRTPLYGTARVFISKNREFNRYDEINKYIDLLMDKLQNEDYTLSSILIDSAAHGKFESPMLGLICSYIYLKSKETKEDGLFKEIVTNMQKLILKDNEECPDLQALNILASSHFPDHSFGKKPVRGTPMLRIGFEAIQNASAKYNSLIPLYSLNDYITENLYYDSPFNTFAPLPERAYEQAKKGESENAGNEPRVKFTEDTGSVNMESYIAFDDERILKPDYSVSIQSQYDNNVIQYFKSPKFNLSVNGWLENSIADIIKSNDNISIDDISSKLSLSGNTVNRIFIELEKQAGNK